MHGMIADPPLSRSGGQRLGRETIRRSSERTAVPDTLPAGMPPLCLLLQREANPLVRLQCQP